VSAVGLIAPVGDGGSSPRLPQEDHPRSQGAREVNGRYVGYVAGDDPLHGFLSRTIRDDMGVREPQPAFRVFRLSGSNEVYAYEEKFSGTKIICKFYGPKFGWDRDKAALMA